MSNKITSNKKEERRIRKVYNKYLSDKSFASKWSNDNIGNMFIFDERKSAIVDILNKNKFNFNGKRILEIGCGKGEVIDLIIELGANEKYIYGIDVRENRIKDSKSKYTNCNIFNMNACNLKFESESFDLITTFTLFSSVVDPGIRKEIAYEIKRVLRPNGSIIFYDIRYNNPMNNNIARIKKTDIENLFTGMEVSSQSITLIPLLARRIGVLTPFLYPILTRIPFLRSHQLAYITK